MIQGHHLKEKCLLQNLCRNLPEEMCFIMSLATEWVCDTAHLGLSPDCTGGCWAADLCHSVCLKHPSQLQWHNPGLFIPLIHLCTVWPQNKRQLPFKSISVSSHIPPFLHYSLWILLHPCPSGLLPAGTVCQSKVRQKFCSFNEIADNVPRAPVTLGIRCI